MIIWELVEVLYDAMYAFGNLRDNFLYSYLISEDFLINYSLFVFKERGTSTDKKENFISTAKFVSCFLKKEPFLEFSFFDIDTLFCLSPSISNNYNFYASYRFKIFLNYLLKTFNPSLLEYFIESCFTKYSQDNFFFSYFADITKYLVDTAPDSLFKVLNRKIKEKSSETFLTTYIVNYYSEHILQSENEERLPENFIECFKSISKNKSFFDELKPPSVLTMGILNIEKKKCFNRILSLKFTFDYSSIIIEKLLKDFNSLVSDNFEIYVDNLFLCKNIPLNILNANLKFAIDNKVKSFKKFENLILRELKSLINLGDFDVNQNLLSNLQEFNFKNLNIKHDAISCYFTGITPKYFSEWSSETKNEFIDDYGIIPDKKILFYLLENENLSFDAKSLINFLIEKMR